ncbi:azurin [Pseudomonas typographi]|uniref:Azurin n=1 Tax=Pseudomonas typographi TaxID=2715964 RepID=A0ABR7Z5G8_9PSED|nr:azurin [Pseudomonas typographi]MBD1551779.1 azurin [Pseudomonas typographi]MBD1587580.1 azurin [Pseudomonas typographi]MBD1600766.1 azurin [Pseudomonas typographi]
MFVKACLLASLCLASITTFAATCETTVDSTDIMTFDTDHIEVSKQCTTFTVHLTHSGGLPVQVMGHNWVLSKSSDAQPVSIDGMEAGFAHNYLKPDDARVIAHTKLIGAGEEDSVTFNVRALDPAEQYTFFCSYPAHISRMKGTLKLVE